jgi:riboflavin kinase/FMN adenylyltransferase
MKILAGVRGWSGKDACGALAMGVFDGIHLGHQRIVRRTAELAQGSHSCLLTFHPHPGDVLGRAGPDFLTTIDQRAEILTGLGLDALIVEPFTPDLASMRHERFIEHLVGVIAPQNIVVGRNFRYGQGAQGDVSTLLACGCRLGFGTSIVEPVMLDGTVVSSTAIRGLLRQGDLEAANRMIGRPYSVRGSVVAGDGRGKTLGFPTANVLPQPRQVIPPRGVYAVRARLGKRAWPAMANIGVRPTFGQSRQVLEVHIIGFSGQIYGETLDVDFVEPLRPERLFSGTDALVEQMKIDKKLAAQALERKLGFVYNA